MQPLKIGIMPGTPDAIALGSLMLENEPAVTASLEKNPFADQPPQYIRAQFYDYTFAGGEERSQGLWWRRRAVGLYPRTLLPEPVCHSAT